MIAVASLLATLLLSLLVTRIAAMALMLTGMSRETAKFQARSAFTGVGFTTRESEAVLNHPMRRQIVMTLMLLGNLGIATVMATVMLSFASTVGKQNWWLNIGLLVAGLFVLWWLAGNRWIERHLNRVISFALVRLTRLEVKDYASLLQLQNGYGVIELLVEPADWVAGQSLMTLRLSKEGVLVLGIQQVDGNYEGTPEGSSVIQAGDSLVLYGPLKRLAELDLRRTGRKGDDAHREAVVELESQKLQEG